MSEGTGNRAGRKIGRALAVAAALLLGTATFQPDVANAAHGGGGGGSHGGDGSHGGGFHGGGFHGGGSHGGGFHMGGFHGGGFHRGFRGGFAVGLGGIYAPYWWGYGYPYNDYYSYYPDYGYNGYDQSCSYYGNCPANGYGAQPYTGQTWYYCSDPAGYYPYVNQCNTGWQAVPAS